MTCGMEFTNHTGDLTLVPFSSILYATKKKTEGTFYFPKEEERGKDALYIRLRVDCGDPFWVTDRHMIDKFWVAYGAWMDRLPSQTA